MLSDILSVYVINLSYSRSFNLLLLLSYIYRSKELIKRSRLSRDIDIRLNFYIKIILHNIKLIINVIKFYCLNSSNNSYSILARFTTSYDIIKKISFLYDNRYIRYLYRSKSFK